MYQAGLLFQIEPNLYRNFGLTGQSGHWKCTLAREIRRFRDITTIEDYLEKRDPLRQSVRVSTIPTTPDTHIMLSAQEIQLHPAIHTKCWGLYQQGNYDDAIFNATKAIKVAVRYKARLPDDLVGASLIAQTFKPDNPILTYSSVRAEKERGMA